MSDQTGNHTMSIMKRKGAGPTLTVHFDKVSIPNVDLDLLYSSADWEAAANGLYDALRLSAPSELLDHLTVRLLERKRSQKKWARIQGGG